LLTKIPSPDAGTYSIMKGVHYPKSTGITDHGAASGADYLAGNLRAVVDSIGATSAKIILPPGIYPVVTSLNFHQNTTLDMTAGASFSVGAGATITINGPIMADQRRSIFDGDGSIAFGATALVEGAWFKKPAETTWENAIYRALTCGAKSVSIRDISGSANNASTMIIPGDDLQIVADGMDITLTQTGDFIEFTGSRTQWTGGTINGNGIIVDTGSATGKAIAIIRFNGDGLANRQDWKISGIKITNFNNAGIASYRSVGGRIHNCVVKNAFTGPFLLGCNGIKLYSSAFIDVTENTITGVNEGIQVGATDTYAFDDFSYLASDTQSRFISIRGNTVEEYYDHGVYVSPPSYGVSVEANKLTPQTGQGAVAIVLTGDKGVIRDNDAINAINYRNAVDAVIHGNSVKMDANNAYGIGVSSITLNAMENILIADNVITCGAATISSAAIYVLAGWSAIDPTYVGEVTLRNVSVVGNLTVGGQNGIMIAQQVHSTRATSSHCEKVLVSNNTCRGATEAGLTSNATASYTPWQDAIVSGNIFEARIGALYKSYRGIFEGNKTLSTNPATGYGMYEVTDADITVGENFYDASNRQTGGTSSQVLIVTNTSVVRNYQRIISPNLSGAATFTNAQLNRYAIITPTGAGAQLNPSGLFSKGTIITVYNLSGVFILVFDATGINVTIAVSSNESFYYDGSAWVQLPP
jgi:hypothetical protein